MRYEEIHPISRDEAKRVFAPGDLPTVPYALLELALYDPGWWWVQDHCVPFLKHPQPCFGHPARIHRALDTDKVRPALAELYGDEHPDVTGHLHDALKEVARRLAVGRTTVYELIAKRELLAIRIRRARRIPESALDTWIAQQPDSPGNPRRSSSPQRRGGLWHRATFGDRCIVR